MDQEIREEQKIKEQKEKIIKFFKNSQVWVIILLIIALSFGVYTRSLPMIDHDHGKIPSYFEFVTNPFGQFNGRPGLWDITTNNWTLGPDLDPWLFERYAKTMIQQGSLPRIDHFRNVPLGFDTSYELQMVSYMIVLTYKIVNTSIISSIIGHQNVEFAAALNPVIMFLFTILTFFLFVREVFVRKSQESKLKANIIAIISTFFMIVIPVFLSRTIAGIPEKEANAFVYMFLSFYLFLKAWKSEKIKYSIVFAAFAGISTAIMGLTWGGVRYVYVVIAVASLLAFIINKFNKKELIAYSVWLWISLILPLLITTRYSLMGQLTSIDTGLCVLIFIIAMVDIIVWKTKVKNIKIIGRFNNKIPKNIISLIIAIVAILILGTILFGPSFFIDKIELLHKTIFTPITGRWNTTVAENRQPDFQEWSQSFGPFIKNIPIMFWMFIIGSILLFKKVTNRLKKKDSWILTALYTFMLFGIIFSRYSSASIFNGENMISKLFYYSSVLFFLGGLIYYYYAYYKKNDKSIEDVDYEFLLLFAVFILTVFTARSAVRVIMVLGPIASILMGFLIAESVERLLKSKDETTKIIMGFFALLVIILSIFVFYNFYNQIKSESYSFVPSMYNQQWQKAMEWVRNETPTNAVFAHWWDYGYWVQSIGDRATVTDGGNAITYWNYLMGRLVLTGDNQKDSLEFLYNHNASYLLVDSSDIGKYGAYSSIGSDKNYDRYSWIGGFLMDEKQTQETQNQTLLVYSGGAMSDEDIILNESGKETYLAGQRTGIGLIVVPLSKIIDNSTNTSFGQPYVIAVYNGKQYKVNLRYLDVSGKFIDFHSGIEGCAFLFPQIIQEGSQVRQNPIGAAMYLSPRLMRGFVVQKYILDDPFNNFPNFKLAHNEPNFIVDNLRSQGMQLPDFIYFQGIQGPIKIWSINYTGKEKFRPEYVDTDANKYLDWQL